MKHTRATLVTESGNGTPESGSSATGVREGRSQPTGSGAPAKPGTGHYAAYEVAEDPAGTLQVLLVGGAAADHARAQTLLNETTSNIYALAWYPEFERAIDAFQKGEFGLCLVDQHIGGKSGLAFVREINAISYRKPIIVLADDDNPDLALLARRAGAIDCLDKRQMTGPVLCQAIRYAVNWKEHEAVLRQTQDELIRQLFEAHDAKARAEQQAEEQIRIAKNLAQTRDQMLTALERAEDSEKQFRQLAESDPLTGLANRTLFRLRLRDTIGQSRRTNVPIAVLLLDLDRFKRVNDSFGHAVGDALLRQVAERLLECVRDTDTVARLSGDEFAIIGTHCAHEFSAGAFARKINQSLTRPYALGGRQVQTGISIGIALSTGDDQSVDELLYQADIALYRAKHDGRGIYRFFDSEMSARERYRRSIETDLHVAVERGELALHYQPKLDAHSHAIVGAEALLRWHHPERGLVSPAEFIPIAEATGQIIGISNWVLRTACRQIVAWKEAGIAPVPIAVNTSAREFRGNELLSSVVDAVDETGIDPQLLEIEITEGVVMDHVENGLRQLNQLRGMGIGIAIDDFGTGYSSLSYLTRFPVDRLKVDKCFVDDMLTDPAQAAVVTTIISLGKSLNLKVTAEGVETEAQLNALRQMDCNEVQGYYFSKPLTAEIFADRYLTPPQARQHI